MSIRGGGARVATGTYTGDGAATQAITGIGFRPKVLRIYQYKEAENDQVQSYMKTDVMSGTLCYIPFHTDAGAQYRKMWDNCIVSLDADGFTVGDDAGDLHPNKSAAVYIYEAFG